MPSRKIFQSAEDKVYFGSGDENGCIVWEWKVPDSDLAKARQVIPEAEAVSYFASAFRQDIAEAAEEAIEEKKRETSKESVDRAEAAKSRRLQAVRLIQQVDAPSFVQQIPGAFVYPFKCRGTMSRFF